MMRTSRQQTRQQTRPQPQPQPQTGRLLRSTGRKLALSRRGGRLAAALVFVVLTLSGCSMHRYDRPKPGTTQRGIASWYGEPFHGRKTANGEIYDMHAMTAAHKELPLGTWVEVRNLDNGRQVRVRVNDRGPFVRGRILDVSYEAARRLGMVGPGTAPIVLRVVELGGGPSGASLTTRFAVQVGAFGERANAEKLHRQLAPDYPEVETVVEDGWHRVRIAGLRSEADAERLRDELRGRGISAVIVRLD